MAVEAIPCDHGAVGAWNTVSPSHFAELPKKRRGSN
jgi:hypothetical protein